MLYIAECIDCSGINLPAMLQALIAERIIFNPLPNLASGYESDSTLAILRASPARRSGDQGNPAAI
jgi:hypothetical protein